MRSSQRVNICEGRASDFDALKHLSVRGVDAEPRACDGGPRFRLDPRRVRGGFVDRKVKFAISLIRH